MKNSILVAVTVLFVGTSMVSCKKDYTCKCSKTRTDGTTSTTSDYSAFSYKDTRTRAEARCNDNTKTGTDLAGNYSINCQIQ